MTDFEALLKALVGARVEFIVVGGLAGRIHGAARLTEDIDVVYKKSRGNVEKLVEALKPFTPYLRGAPPGLPFKWDAPTVWAGLNFTLDTSAGDIDLLGEITGGGRYEDIETDCVNATMFGVAFKCLDLDKLIEVKRAAGRVKDFDALGELQRIQKERFDSPSDPAP